MEPLITIPLSEYSEMKQIADEFKKAFDENKTILFHDSYFPGHSGYPTHKFTVVNKDVFIADLINKIKDLESENKKWSNELYEIKKKTIPKKSWF